MLSFAPPAAFGLWRHCGAGRCGRAAPGRQLCMHWKCPGQMASRRAAPRAGAGLRRGRRRLRRRPPSPTSPWRWDSSGSGRPKWPSGRGQARPGIVVGDDRDPVGRQHVERAQARGHALLQVGVPDELQPRRLDIQDVVAPDVGDVGQRVAPRLDHEHQVARRVARRWNRLDARQELLPLADELQAVPVRQETAGGVLIQDPAARSGPLGTCPELELRLVDVKLRIREGPRPVRHHEAIDMVGMAVAEHDRIDTLRTEPGRSQVGQEMPGVGSKRLRRTHAGIEDNRLAPVPEHEDVLLEHQLVRRQEAFPQHAVDLLLRRAAERDLRIAAEDRAVGNEGQFRIAQLEPVVSRRLVSGYAARRARRQSRREGRSRTDQGWASQNLPPAYRACPKGHRIGSSTLIQDHGAPATPLWRTMARGRQVRS